jgi:hypothetical protein
VATDSPLPPHLVVVAAQHAAMSISAGVFEQAMDRLREAGVPDQPAVALKTLARADPSVQLELLRRHRFAGDDSIRCWLADHGANRRVRTYARHGLYLRARGEPTAAIAR